MTTTPFLEVDMVSDALLTASYTILGGVIVFVLSQFALKIFIEPIHELRKTIGEIAHHLSFYANVYSNTGLSIDRYEKAKNEFRHQATLLLSKMHQISWYKFFSFIRLMPNKNSIVGAHQELIGLSHSIPPRNSKNCIENMERRKQISAFLNLSLK